VRFLIDARLPPNLAKHFSAHGHDATHVSTGPAVIWVRIGNTTNRALLERFAEKFTAIIASLERGETIVEISDR
jgi:predicted nuclease of predicted toxin-antitoxin system